ncbi:MAG: RNA polymerase sigma factor, partial [Bacteroidetes bacterium]
MTDFKALYDRHAGDIYRFALFLSGNEADAKDITAETFARALTGKSPLKTATVKGYLLTIARNLYLESLRKKGRMAAMPAGLQDKSPDPGQQLHGKLELEALMRFLQNFPEPDRAALLL